MGFVKNMMEHDLALLQTLDGQYIIHTPKQGKPRVIDGMLQTRASLIPGGSIEMISTEIILSVRGIDSHDMQVGEKIAVDNNTYEIASIRPDNEGITEVSLEKI